MVIFVWLMLSSQKLSSNMVRGFRNKGNIFRDFMQLNELQLLEPDFKG